MMRNIAIGALLAGLLVACGKSSSHPDGPIIMTDDAPAAGCDPVAQTGCETGQKCTWVRLQANTTTQTGIKACVPDGSVALNGDCKWGAAGASTGYDNCQKGLICLGSSRTDQATGSCLAICDQSALAGAAGACQTNYACGGYVNFFYNSGETPSNVGLCDPTCNPLTQQRDYDKADHCGGPLDANNQPTLGCIGLPSSDATPSNFTCGHVLDPAKTGDVSAYDTNLGGVFLNSCAAGYIPLLYDNTKDALAKDETKVICVAYCQPAPTSTSATTMAGGAGKYTCAAAGTGGNHECRYWWFLEDATTPVSNWSNDVGYCYDYTQYTFDGSMLHPPQGCTTDNTGKTTCTRVADPSCTKLSDTLMTFDAKSAGGTQTIPDNLFWGCAPEPTMFTGGPRPAHAPSVLRPFISNDQVNHIVKSWD
jgi:hypothetical protein